jgi:hypothetical protein
MFQFTCFNVEDQDDPSVGLINGELAIPGNLLRQEVFDPVIDQVLQLIEDQERRVNQRIDALLMVGGFSGSEYMLKRVEQRFGSRMRVVRPADADTATVRGAAQYGLARRPLVQSVIAPKAYLMKVKLPAEQEDWNKRPAYIKKNDAGVDICENRLQYLVQKGAILLKGQRIRTRFCKFSKEPNGESLLVSSCSCGYRQLLVGELVSTAFDRPPVHRRPLHLRLGPRHALHRRRRDDRAVQVDGGPLCPALLPVGGEQQSGWRRRGVLYGFRAGAGAG